MSYASVMVYVEADGAPEERVRLAASLADKFDAMLIGLSALAQSYAVFLLLIPFTIAIFLQRWFNKRVGVQR